MNLLHKNNTNALPKANSTDTHDFGEGSISGNILRLAIPMTLAQLINVLYNIIDRIYIGHLPDVSTQALTGIGLTLPVITIITAFTNLFGMGGAPLFSMARGAGEPARARKILGNSFSMLLISGGILMILCYLFKRPLLYLFGASDITYPYANAYISLYLIGTLFVMISLGMNNFINAQGFGMTGMLTVSIGAVLNLILDPLFIFVLHMGVRGAALATIISQGISAIWVLHFLTGKKAILTLSLAYMKLDFRLVKEICALGLAGFIMAITNGSVQIVCNATLSRYGGDLYVGIMTVINSVREVIQMPVSGISNSAQPILSFNYGADKNSRVKQTIRYMSVALLIYTVAAWILTMIFARQFILLFDSTPELLSLGASCMHIYFFGFFMMSFQFAGQSVFTALGRSKNAIFFSLLRKVIIVIPLIYLLPLTPLGVNGVFWAEPVSNFFGGAACFITMYFTVYKKL